MISSRNSWKNEKLDDYEEYSMTLATTALRLWKKYDIMFIQVG